MSIDGNAGTDESKGGSEVSNEDSVESIWGSVVSIAGRVESIGGRDESILGRVESIAGDSLVAAVVDVVVVGALVAVVSVASKFSESVDGCAESAGGLVSLLSTISTHRRNFRADKLSVLGQWMKVVYDIRDRKVFFNFLVVVAKEVGRPRMLVQIAHQSLNSRPQHSISKPKETIIARIIPVTHL